MNLKAHENRCVVRRHQRSPNQVLRARALPVSCKRFRRCPRSPSQNWRTRAPLRTMLLPFHPSSASFPLTTPPALPPPRRKHPRPRRGKPPLQKRLARPKRRSPLPSMPNALHTPSRSSTILICLYLVAVSRPRRVWSGTTACLPPLAGLGGVGGFITFSTCVDCCQRTCVYEDREKARTLLRSSSRLRFWTQMVCRHRVAARA